MASVSARCFSSRRTSDCDGGVEQALPGILDGQIQLRRPVAGLLVNLALDQVERALRIEFDE